MHLNDVIRLIDVGKLLFHRQRLIQKPAKLLESVFGLEFQYLVLGHHAADVGVVVEIGLAELVAVLDIATRPDAHDEVQDLPIRNNTFLYPTRQSLNQSF